MLQNRSFARFLMVKEAAQDNRRKVGSTKERVGSNSTADF